MRIGKQTQFFGVRVNHLKTFLYAINSGRDEMSGDQVRSMRRPIEGEVLSCDIVFESLDTMMEPLAKTMSMPSTSTTTCTTNIPVRRG